MAIIRLKVTYADGRVVEINASPRARVMAEQYVDGNYDSRSILAHYYMAWAALNKAGKESADFETWLDQIADATEVDAEQPDPTPPAPSGADSSE